MSDPTMFETDDNVSFDFLDNLNDSEPLYLDAPDPEEFLNVLNNDRCTIIFSLTHGNETLSEKNFEDVQVRLERHHDMAQLDMLNGPIREMTDIWSILNAYGASMEKDVANATPELTEYAKLHITIVPEKYNGSTVLMCVNPVFWAMTAYDLNEPANIVRMMFFPECVDVYQNEIVKTDDEEKPEITPDMDFVSMDTFAVDRDAAREAYREKYGQ